MRDELQRLPAIGPRMAAWQGIPHALLHRSADPFRLAN